MKRFNWIAAGVVLMRWLIPISVVVVISLWVWAAATFGVQEVFVTTVAIVILLHAVWAGYK